MEQRYAVTVEQQELLKCDLGELKAKLANLVDSTRACHGEGSPVYMRVQEIAGALQRMEWALERDHAGEHAMSVSVSMR